MSSQTSVINTPASPVCDNRTHPQQNEVPSWWPSETQKHVGPPRPTGPYHTMEMSALCSMWNQTCTRQPGQTMPAESRGGEAQSNRELTFHPAIELSFLNFSLCGPNPLGRSTEKHSLHIKWGIPLFYNHSFPLEWPQHTRQGLAMTLSVRHVKESMNEHLNEGRKNKAILCLLEQ